MKNLNHIPPDPLAGLKDIHLPPQPGWWPPAPGWWLLLILILVILFFLLKRWYRRQNRLRPIKLALKELESLNFTVTDPDQRRFLLQQVSALLRRFALAFFEDEEKEIAELCGESWLDFLCAKSGPVDRVKLRKNLAPLVLGPYAPTCEVELKALQSAVAGWLKNLRRHKSRPAAAGSKRQSAVSGESL